MQSNDNELHLHLAENSYQSPEQRQAHLASKYGSRFRVDTSRNYDNYAAVHDTHTNRVYHLHRGTTNADDVGTDVGLAFGNLHNTQRYKTTDERVRDTHNAYATQQHTHIGHSLGGTLADTFARHYGDKSVAYNMGSSPFAPHNDASSDHRHIRIGTDAVSQFQNTTGSEVLQKKENKLDQFVKQVNNPFTQLGGATASLGLAHRLWNTYQSHLLSNFHN